MWRREAERDGQRAWMRILSAVKEQLRERGHEALH